MAFKRREGLAGGGITRYADTNFHNCPFCKTSNPYWLSDAYIANYSLISANCVNGYKFQCSSCGGVLEVQGHSDFCFQNGRFVSVKLVDPGRGLHNKDLVGKPLTIEALKQLCLPTSSTTDKTVQEQPAEQPVAQPVYQQQAQPQPQYNPYSAPQYNPYNSRPIKTGKSGRTILSTLGMVFGIVGLVFSFLALALSSDSDAFYAYLLMASVALELGVAGIVLGAIGLKKEYSKKGIPGIICGGIGVFFTFISIIVAGIVLAEYMMYYL